VLTDEVSIPMLYYKQILKLDKTMLKDAIKNGETVPGAELSNGGMSLVIRRS
jgi:hypothetical protein